MMKKIIFMIIALLTISMVVAQVELDLADAQGKRLPGLAKSLFGDQRANIHIATDSGEQTLGVVTEDGIIVLVEESAISEPTINVYTDQVTVENIVDAENQLLAFKTALDEDEITYSAIGFGNKVKFGFASIGARVVSWFSSDDNEQSNGVTGAVVIKRKVAVEEPEVKKEQKLEPMEDSTIKEVEKQPEDTSETHTVLLTEKGFEPRELEIKVGDTVIWDNMRERYPNKAMIIGVRECSEVRSDIYTPGEKFSWTFDEAKKCTIAGGILTTAESKIIITE